jgi:5'-deoxynucleotidase YfbR-like HD superfamily hydrolase
MYKEIDLSIFPKEREEKLKQIYRYSYFDVVYYRSNLWMHTHRVLWLLEELIPIAKKSIDFDEEKARALALVHDDPEMLTGDIQAIEKQRMTKEQQSKMEENDLRAIDEIAKQYPEFINGYSYRELLRHAAKKDCIEAKLVSYVDKLDAYCESLHDLYAGNLSLLRSVVFYANALPLFPIKYPELKELLSSKESTLTFLTDQISPGEILFENYKSLNKPHTKESLLINTDFPFYKTWKHIVIERGRMDWLIDQKEYPKN